eukprot:TRINITY_DN67129_c9_g1_i1.p1 TRINITY_DN67129_c9_g1~~TRINITY_DN67129_c9_g1_i1.p1  ORF type:complete len:109 (-),score=7.10 TRINITY_DN67129_c9_g1_i1:79-405(-)
MGSSASKYAKVPNQQATTVWVEWAEKRVQVNWCRYDRKGRLRELDATSRASAWAIIVDALEKNPDTHVHCKVNGKPLDEDPVPWGNHTTNDNGYSGGPKNHTPTYAWA